MLGRRHHDLRLFGNAIYSSQSPWAELTLGGADARAWGTSGTQG
jgi:hypothetical protein